MARRICHAEHGRHAGVADLGSQLRPRVSVELRSGVRREFEQAQELGLELRFERRDGHELCIRSLIHAVERRTAITEVGAPFIGPDSRRVAAVDTYWVVQ